MNSFAYTCRQIYTYEYKNAMQLGCIKKLLTEWTTDLDECLQNGSTTAVSAKNQISCQNQNWQAIIIVDTKAFVQS